MEKIKIKLTLVIFLAMIIMVNFVSAQIPELSNCQGVNLEYRNKGEGYATYDLKIKEGTGSQGSFNIYSSCQGGFQVQPVDNTKTIVGTEIISGQIQIEQINNLDSSSQCTIIASIKRLGFSAEDTCTFIVTGTKSCKMTTESCSANTDCCEGLSCFERVCREIPAGLEICDNQIDDNNNDLVDCFDRDCRKNTNCIKEDINTDNNSITSTLIIALGIIVGLIVLGLLIRKRNKN